MISANTISGVAAAVDRSQQSALCIKMDERLAFFTILDHAPVQSFRCRRPSGARARPPQRGQTEASDSTCKPMLMMHPHFEQPAGGEHDPRMAAASTSSESATPTVFHACSTIFECFRLPHRARKAVENKSAVVRIKPGSRHFDNHLVRHQPAFIGKFRRLAPKRGSNGLLLAQNRADRWRFEFQILRGSFPPEFLCPKPAGRVKRCAVSPSVCCASQRK